MFKRLGMFDRSLGMFQPSKFIGGAPPFTPAALFAAGEQGVWYDPSDLSTMFQDSAGTTPVTAIEQPVGLLLDKSKNGVGTNGAARYNLLTYTEQFDNAVWAVSSTTKAASLLTDTATTAVHGLYRTNAATETLSATTPYTVKFRVKKNTVRYISIGFWNNATLNCGAGFDLDTGTVTGTGGIGTGYSASSAGIESDGAGGYWCSVVCISPLTSNFTAILHRNTAYTSGTITESYLGTVSNSTYLYGADTRLASDAAKLPLYQPITSSWAATLPGNHAFQTTTTARPVLRNLYNLLVQTATLSTQNVTTRATSHTLSFSGAGAVTLSGTATGTFSAGTNTFSAIAGALTLTVSGTVSEAMLIEANEGTIPYQWVTTGTAGGYNTDTTLFKPYLAFDGTDDFLVTGNIDFSATDKMSVFAGYRILGGTGSQIMAETSSNSFTTTGAFACGQGTAAASSGFGFLMNAGSGMGGQSTNLTVPYTSVVDFLLDSSQSGLANEALMRLNAVSTTFAVAVGTDSGTANFSSYPLYIGRRAGATVPFNGRIYSLLIRGALTTSPQLEKTENWVNSKTGAY